MKRFSLLFCAVLLCVTGTTSQTGSSKKAPAAEANSAKPIAVHPFRVEGVNVALMEVTRTAPNVVTVKWEYRNTSDGPAELAANSKGWSDPYRLCWDTYLLQPDGTKIPVMKDNDRKPICAMHGGLNQLKISVPPQKTLATWAKYPVPAEANNVSVVIVGADPFDNVTVSEPAK